MCNSVYGMPNILELDEHNLNKKNFKHMMID